MFHTLLRCEIIATYISDWWIITNTR